MSTFPTMWGTCLVVLLPLLLAAPAFGQFPWQKPVSVIRRKSAVLWGQSSAVASRPGI